MLCYKYYPSSKNKNKNKFSTVLVAQKHDSERDNTVSKMFISFLCSPIEDATMELGNCGTGRPKVNRDVSIFPVGPAAIYQSDCTLGQGKYPNLSEGSTTCIV